MCTDGWQQMACSGRAVLMVMAVTLNWRGLIHLHGLECCSEQSNKLFLGTRLWAAKSGWASAQFNTDPTIPEWKGQVCLIYPSTFDHLEWHAIYVYVVWMGCLITCVPFIVYAAWGAHMSMIIRSPRGENVRTQGKRGQESYSTCCLWVVLLSCIVIRAHITDHKNCSVLCGDAYRC